MKRPVKVIVLCRNAEGAPDLYACTVQATADEVDCGEHYAMGIKMAESVGFESPFEAFDEYDPAGRQLMGLCKWLGADPTEGSPADHYLLIMVGDVEPELSGPYIDPDAVLQAARRQRMDDVEMENGLYRLTVRDRTPEVDAFAGVDLDVEECCAENGVDR